MSTAQTTPAPKTRKPRAAAAPKAGKAPRKAKARASDTGVAPRKPRAPKVVVEGAELHAHARSTDALREAAKGYVRDKEHKTAGGHVSVNNGDEIATKLLGKDLDQVYAMAAKALKEDEADLRKKYGHLNPGMARMNLGNRMRAAAK